jgi:2-keto-4-pentenoate hydratase/2-oxohepta-3-ene-1,7-dioic acid hydratase in catechol pathway/pimeloyl-ACP methyl ester carboxylesterase
MSLSQANGTQSHVLTNYCSYLAPDSQTERIGSLSEDGNSIQPLAFASGTPLTNLYEVINAGDSRIIASGDQLDRSSIKLLAPINGRDILCVGKNYAAHATEFNKSGYDSSDKADQPTHPVIFTKRFSSIIADGEEIYPHPKFTSTIDYEGELGVIIGKTGFRISEADAMEYVWGYTICNDVTARERQRDHKQFYIGKSPDTFGPMGPIAVPKERLRMPLTVQTRVNGALRQEANTDDLIFSIPFLIMTLSEGQTLMPGDVLATGTPAGVGFGQDPPTYLEPGDEVSVSITGLGSLTNRIASKSSKNPTVKQVEESSSRIRGSNTAKAPNGNGLSWINGKRVHYQKSGVDNGPPAVFVHGLGGTMDYWAPLISAGDLGSTYALHLYDFEGHGLSPTSPLSELTLDSLADDLKGLFDHGGIPEGAVLFAHSLGCLIAVHFVLKHPGLVSKLILAGPPPSPLPEAGSKGSYARAALARSNGMSAVVDAVVCAGLSEKTKASRAVSVAAVRLSLLGQDPEGYAKACSALAKSTNTYLDFSRIPADTLIITGTEDKISPPQLCKKYNDALQGRKGLKILQDVGHWHVFEDPEGVVGALSQIL